MDITNIHPDVVDFFLKVLGGIIVFFWLVGKSVGEDTSGR